MAVQPWNTCMQGSPCSLQSSCALGVCYSSALMSAEGKPSSLNYPGSLEDEYLFTTEVRLSSNLFLKTTFSGGSASEMHLTADLHSLKAACTSFSSCLELVFQSHLSDSVVITLHLNAVHDGKTILQRSPVFLCRALQAAMLHQRPAAHIPVSGTAPMQASRYSTSICVHCVESCHQVLLLFFFSLCDQDGNSYLHLYFES